MDENRMPELTLDPLGEKPAAPAVPEKAPPLDDRVLSEAEKRQVAEFAQKIDLMDSNLILQYGAAAQKHVAGFSEDALASVRNKDMG